MLIQTHSKRRRTGKSNEDKKLASSYLNCLKLAEKYNLKTIAFPNISTGIYGFPKGRAAKIAIDVIHAWKGNSFDQIIFVCYDDENYNIYNELM